MGTWTHVSNRLYHAQQKSKANDQNTMKALRYLAICVLISLFLGCRTQMIVHSEATLFLLHHPSERHNYTRLDPIGLELLKEQLAIRHNSRINMIKAFEQHFAENNDVQGVCTSMKKAARVIQADEVLVVKQIEKILSASPGELYYYNWQDAKKNSETGYVVIKAGEIIGKAGITHGHILE